MIIPPLINIVVEPSTVVSPPPSGGPSGSRRQGGHLKRRVERWGQWEMSQTFQVVRPSKRNSKNPGLQFTEQQPQGKPCSNDCNPKSKRQQQKHRFPLARRTADGARRTASPASRPLNRRAEAAPEPTAGEGARSLSKFPHPPTTKGTRHQLHTEAAQTDRPPLRDQREGGCCHPWLDARARGSGQTVSSSGRQTA
jgi:hypothetical protein